MSTLAVTRRAATRNPVGAAYAAVYALLVVLVVYGAASEPAFRTWDNAVNVLNQSIVLGLVAIGQTLVVLSGGIDFSVGGVVKVSVVVGAIVMNGREGLVVPAILASLAVGLAIGLANGLVVTQLAANPFIVTFGMASVLRGIVFTISTAPIGLAATGYLQIYDASLGSLPYAVIVMAVLWALAWLVAARTPFGRSLYAVGGNDVVARLAGMRPDRVRVAVYALSGVLAAFAGIYALARSGIGDPTAGDNLEFDAITAVALGGTSLYGGVGGVGGTLGGVLLLTLVSNVFNLLQISSWYQGMLRGAIILAAVALYVRRRRV